MGRDMADTHGAPMLAIHHHTLSRAGICCPAYELAAKIT